MESQENINYNRIAKAIAHINANFREQPSLDEIAEKVHLSPYHFQRMFKEWAGITPKKFLQYTSVQHAKKVLSEENATLFDAAMDTGLSGTSRLHDLFISIEGMTPGEFKNDGENLNINYSYAHSPFGLVVIASTTKGVCHISFTEDEEKGLYELKSQFPKATYHQRVDQIQANALLVFSKDWSQVSNIKLHLKGTDFQLKVWESLHFSHPKGKPHHIWKNCQNGGKTQGVKSGRDGHWQQPDCVPDSMPSGNSIFWRVWRLSLGQCAQNCNYRMGSCSSSINEKSGKKLGGNLLGKCSTGIV